MNILEVMQQARQMQEQLQKRMSDLRVEASAGGGMVTVVVNGAKQVQSIRSILKWCRRTRSRCCRI